MFNRVGRGLELTETGRQVQVYADEIFSLDMELEQMVRAAAGEPADCRGV
jgi:LysR family transcriptional activator of nhaA